jgi:hypothetical protein
MRMNIRPERYLNAALHLNVTTPELIRDVETGLFFWTKVWLVRHASHNNSGGKDTLNSGRQNQLSGVGDA